MRAARLDQILREFREGLEQIYGSRLVRVVLFGSQAREEAEPDSDIDVMLVLQGAVDPHREIQRLSVIYFRPEPQARRGYLVRLCVRRRF